MLKIVYRQYKNDQCLDEPNIQRDFSFIGSECINFIATVTTCRLIARAKGARQLYKMSCKDLMNVLCTAWWMVNSPIPPRSDDGFWVYAIVCVFEKPEALGLSTPVSESESKKHGRAKKEPQEQKPKHPRGHQRKNPWSSINVLYGRSVTLI